MANSSAVFGSRRCLNCFWLYDIHNHSRFYILRATSWFFSRPAWIFCFFFILSDQTKRPRPCSGAWMSPWSPFLSPSSSAQFINLSLGIWWSGPPSPHYHHTQTHTPVAPILLSLSFWSGGPCLNALSTRTRAAVNLATFSTKCGGVT